jgi:hypothetical protein
MTRAFTIFALACAVACGSSTVAPTLQGPGPDGTYVLDRAPEDSAVEAVASPVPSGRVCLTLSNTLRFFAGDSVIETRQYVAQGAPVIFATDVDTGVVTRAAAGMFALTYPRRPSQTRYDTAYAFVESGAVLRLGVTEHFLSNSLCVTERMYLPYKRQGSF